MNRTIAILAVAVCAACAVCATAYAIYDVVDEGLWPKSWPKELEPLRKQARTTIGPLAPHMHRYYGIRFANREEFESAWPHLVKVKSKGAPIFLVRGPHGYLGTNRNSGVVVHAPPIPEAGEPAPPEVPIPESKDARTRWKNTTYIELVVDGAIVDLNCIPLPADTPIIDERFKDEKKK